MKIQNTDTKQYSLPQRIYRFLGGAALGLFVVIIPISYASFIDWNLLQVSIASLLVISCGLLSSIWGEKFIDAVTRVLDSCGF
jgi:ABC-type bacteriocin/lantibiotic exporter with double-glycine peptidase domain